MKLNFCHCLALNNELLVILYRHFPYLDNLKLKITIPTITINRTGRDILIIENELTK